MMDPSSHTEGLRLPLALHKTRATYATSGPNAGVSCLLFQRGCTSQHRCRYAFADNLEVECELRGLEV
jgi:hypothetical protein